MIIRVMIETMYGFEVMVDIFTWLTVWCGMIFLNTILTLVQGQKHKSLYFLSKCFTLVQIQHFKMWKCLFKIIYQHFIPTNMNVY